MANFKGNPEFGKKYRAERKTSEALLEQVGTRVPTKTKLQLKEIANEKNCSVPDLVRAAIEQYLASMEPEKVA